MKHVREIQYEKVRELYTLLCKHEGRTPVLADIKGLQRNTVYSSSRLPLSGQYRLKPYKTVDLKSLNSEMGLTLSDAETVFDYLDALQVRIRELRYVSDVWKRYVLRKIEGITRDAAKFTSAMFIEGFTQIIDFLDQMNKDETDATLSQEGYVGLPSVSCSKSGYLYKERDVSIQRLGEDLTVEIIGNPLDLVNLAPPAGLILRLTGKSVREVGFRIIINTDLKGINCLILKLNENGNGIRVVMETTSDRKSYQTVYTDVVSRQTVEVSIPEQDITQLVVSVTMDMPNLVSAERNVYEFVLDKIVMTTKILRSRGVYQTKAITLDDDVKMFSLVTDEEILGKGSIKHYLSLSQDEEDNPVGFSLVEAGEIRELDRVANIVEIGPSIEEVWDLVPERRYGSLQYNILEDITQSAAGFSIHDGVLECAELIDDSVKLYRGVGDFLKSSAVNRMVKSIESLAYDLRVNTKTGWVEQLPLLIPVRENIEESAISDSGGLTRNRIRLGYPLRNYEEIRLIYQDGTEFYAPITNIEEGYPNYVVFGSPDGTATEVLPEGDHFAVSYVTTLNEYIVQKNVKVNLELASFEVRVGDDVLEHGRDFILYPTERKLELLKSGRYQEHFLKLSRIKGWINPTVIYEGQSRPLTVTYSFEEIGSENTAFYETQVYVKEKTELTILPFTEQEIDAGNFHRIDGDDVSRFYGFIIEPGWHSIASTQPYPSWNAYDVNPITGERSSAGIVLPSNIEIMRPFKDSMRRVSAYRLANLKPSEASKCFAFQDGKILVSFRPDFIDPVLVYDDSMGAIKALSLYGKKAEIDTDFSNLGYTPAPEKFQLEFAYKGTGGRTIVVRSVLTLDSPDATVRIRKMGLNLYKGESDG